MNTSNKIESLINKLALLGPLLPGTISEQWNVCGKANCKCKDKKNPQKHGPYYQLSYNIAGKNSTMFIKSVDLKEAQKRQENYKKFRQFNNDLILAHIAHARKEGFNNEQSNK